MTAPVRYTEFLRQRYRAILGYTGLLGLIASLLIASPVLLLAFYPQETPVIWAFVLPALALGLPGLFVWRRLTPRPSVSLTMQEGAVIVVLAWLLSILVGAIPFAVSSGLGLTHSLFESTSAWTTAGLSVLDVGRASPLILFYRSVLQLAGGAGLAIIMLSALAGPSGPGLTVAEGRNEQLLPHVRRSARLVLSIYVSYVVAGVVALRLAGMGWFDAVNHAFAAVSTGGFSTRPESLAYWQSPAVQVVTIVLMLLGTLNFLTAYTLFRGNLRAVARNSEARQTALVLLLAVVVLLVGVTAGLYATVGQDLMVAVFNAVSALSTTGFSTVDFGQWNGLGLLVMTVLMLMGGGTGSTAGGIKQYRIHVLCKGVIWEFKQRLLPSRVVSEPRYWQGEQRRYISERHLRQVGLFIFVYLVAFFLVGGVITAHGYRLGDSLFEAASALSTVGISVGITRPGAPAGVLWAEMVAMILGRLEFFAIIIGLIKLGQDLPVMLVPGLKARLAARASARSEKGDGEAGSGGT